MKDYLPANPFRSVVARLAALVIVVFGISGFALAKEILEPPAAIFEFSHAPGSLIVSYALHIGEIAGVDRGPTLHIYGDGLAHVYYPAYMTRAGDYGIQLSEDEMVSLLESLVADGVIEFDSAGARVTARETDALRREREGTMHYVSDPSTSVIEMNLLSYTPLGASSLQKTNVNKTIRWSGLQSDARLYPNHAVIQNLAVAERRLRAFMDRPDLVRVDPQTRHASPTPGKD